MEKFNQLIAGQKNCRVQKDAIQSLVETSAKIRVQFYCNIEHVHGISPLFFFVTFPLIWTLETLALYKYILIHTRNLAVWFGLFPAYSNSMEILIFFSINDKFVLNV